MRFTIRQLEIFLAVAKYQNISRAAETLHMSQSAASAALQTFENNYNAELFDRTGNTLALNASGRTVRDKAEALVAHCQQFETSLLGHSEVGHLKVGASFTIGNHLAVRYLAGYLAEHPAADVQLGDRELPIVGNLQVTILPVT